MEGYVKQVSLFVPAEQYKMLKEIGKVHALSVSHLIKKGILLVINEYYEGGCVGEEVVDNEIGKKKDVVKEDGHWNDNQEPSKC